MKDDKNTPEGKFKMKTKFPHKKWSKFIWIDYPNNDSRRKHNTAKKEGKIPKNADIGGEVGIHGVPKGMDFLIDTKFNFFISFHHHQIDTNDKDLHHSHLHTQYKGQGLVRSLHYLSKSKTFR